MAINTGKVLQGGLLAGLVFNVGDFLNNYLLVGKDFTANATRLGLDPAVAESGAAIASWVVIDFLLGIVVVWTYAAIRPRFGPGVKTAIYAGLIPFFSIALIIFGFVQSGYFTMPIYVKMLLASLVITSAGAVAGAWAYKES